MKLVAGVIPVPCAGQFRGTGFQFPDLRCTSGRCLCFDSLVYGVPGRATVFVKDDLGFEPGAVVKTAEGDANAIGGFGVFRKQARTAGGAKVAGAGVSGVRVGLVGCGFPGNFDVRTVEKRLHQMAGSGGAAAGVAVALGHALRFPVHLVTHCAAMTMSAQAHIMFPYLLWLASVTGAFKGFREF